MRTVQIATYWNLGQGHISPLQWVTSVRPYSMSGRLKDILVFGNQPVRYLDKIQSTRNQLQLYP